VKDERPGIPRISMFQIEVSMNPETSLSGRRWHWLRLILFATITALLLWSATCSASIALLMEEPYGSYGAYNPTGHAAVYLDHVCAATPTQLRMCRQGELGVVVSRYLRVHGNDWVAMPLVPYLYAVDDLANAPYSPDPAKVRSIRIAYWQAHLQDLAPANKDGSAPMGFKHGLWIGLVGASYDRDIHGYQLDTTTEQDLGFIEKFNAGKNVSQYNLLFDNCADFANSVVKAYFPFTVRRNFIGDLGVLTPKRVSQAFVKYGRRHDDLHLSSFFIPQVEGRVPRSYPIRGFSESIVKSKRYIVPLVLINPTFAVAAIVGYLTEVHTGLPKNATVIDLRSLANQPTVTLSGSSLAITLETGGVAVDPVTVREGVTAGPGS